MRTKIALASLGLVSVLAISGCSAASNAEPPAAASNDSHAAVDTVNSDGAGLRAQVTALLADHVYLAGAAINQALAEGGDLTTEKVGGALAALDENSVEIAALVGSVYPEAEQPFLDSWRSHIPFFVDYTVAKATGDDAGVEKALSDLNGYAMSFGELMNSVVPELPAEAVQKELETHAVSLLAAIDANISGDPAYFDLLKEAASHMQMTAQALAGGIASNKGIE